MREQLIRDVLICFHKIHDMYLSWLITQLLDEFNDRQDELTDSSKIQLYIIKKLAELQTQTNHNVLKEVLVGPNENICNLIYMHGNYLREKVSSQDNIGNTIPRSEEFQLVSF